MLADLKLTKGYLLIEQEPAKSSYGLLQLTTSQATPDPIGIVLARGADKVLDNGVAVNMGIQVGDRVIFEVVEAEDFLVAGKTYKIVHQDKILGVIES